MRILFSLDRGDGKGSLYGGITMTREEAINVVKKNWPDSNYTILQEALTTLIPELEESEYERIRKAIIGHLKNDVDFVCNGITKDECLAWLEKQKINTDGDFARGYDCGYECCLNSHGAEWFEKQKEHPTDAKLERVIKAARRVLNNWLDGTDCPDVSGDFGELEYAIREYDGEEKQKESKPEVKDQFDDEEFRIGYDAGKKDARKEQESMSTFYYPTTYEPPCFHGGICTNPFRDCINCPRIGGNMGTTTTSGTYTKD